MTGERAENRQVFEITGEDRVSFLQGLVTNDLAKLAKGLVYAALLTPQGKYLADFFLVPRNEALLLDIDRGQADALLQRLALYRLRARIAIADSGLAVTRGLDTPPPGAFADPRHPALGWRAYGAEAGGPPEIDWNAIRVAHCIPECGAELIPGESYILECGFERLDGVDFRKGCYVGQEVTARMKHKTELRKGLARVAVSGKAEPGAEITADGKPVGRLTTRAGDRAIAYLRFDKAGADIRAGEAAVSWEQG